jgi:hypothetical protein
MTNNTDSKKRMNIYLLERTDSVGYDEFDSFVVVAPDAELARKLLHEHSDGDYGVWAKDELVTATKIGTSDEYAEPIEILGSFNAG